MSKQFKMKVYKFFNSTFFDNQVAVSEYNSKLVSNLRKLHENTQDSHPEMCSKSFKTKNHVTMYVCIVMEMNESKFTYNKLCQQ